MDAPLVICIGNVARGDDGVAHRVADLLAGAEGLIVLAAPQLDVTMAEQVADSPLAIFVDAERRAGPPVRVEDLAPSAPDMRSAHGLTPEGLLDLAETLYGAAPPAKLVSVAAPEMGHTLELSGTAEAASGEAASEIRRIVAAR